MLISDPLNFVANPAPIPPHRTLVPPHAEISIGNPEVQSLFWPFPDQGRLLVLAALILASQLQNYGSSSVADLNGQIWTFLSDFLRSSIAWADLKTCTLLISRAGQFAQKLGSVMSADTQTRGVRWSAGSAGHPATHPDPGNDGRQHI